MLNTKFNSSVNRHFAASFKVRKSPKPRQLIWVLICLSALCGEMLAQNYRPGYQGNQPQRRAFQQEIARLEITVERSGKTPLPMSMVPRVQTEDLIRVKMLDEPINGIRPSDSFWDWTLTVAFINPSRNEAEQESVSREISFKRDGWYREHSFKVPYDSQPIFFLYPKPKYRKKIKKLVNKNFSEIKKIGEKTLEIAGAYAQIGMFLNELQGVINQNNSGYGGYSRYGSGFGYGNQNPFREGFLRDQFVERLAQSFNIALPNCWNTGNNSYNSNDFVGRAQCVAKNVRLEDFDLSVSRMLQQGGLLAATKLVEKYPQLAYWINVAAAAADLIIKILRKTPLRIVPTVASSNINNRNAYNPQYGNRYAQRNKTQTSQKISLFAEKPPGDSDFVTAFPIVLHKWQADPDPEVISLPVPSLLEPCLHMGQNILKNTDLSYDWLRDPFARDFRLIMSAENGFSKEFRLTKNLGMAGWMLTLNPQDLQAFPKVKMSLESKIVANRGFNQIESKKFAIPISGGGNWEILPESIREFAVGGKRRVVIKNTMGSCRCLQTVKYRPSFGGEFTFATGSASNALRFSEDGREAWFEIDTTHFRPGQGTLEMRAYGKNQQPQNIPLNLFPLPPKITKLIAYRGDKKVIVEGDRIEQITAVAINGKRAQLDKPRQNAARIKSNQRTFVFQNPADLILSNNASIEMSLQQNRVHKDKRTFPVLPARPTIKTNENNEIDGTVIDRSSVQTTSKFDLSKYPIVSVETEKISVSVKTTLADYGFMAENLGIETRIEKGQVGQNALPRPTFEVLDSFNLRINFVFSKQYQQFLAGRRLQFRIKDRVRGDSDWYTLKQTFVRIPKIDSVICRAAECKVTGKGLDYIGQVSTDGGKVWQPSIRVQPTPDGKSNMTIQGAKEKKLLRIKLRDFPKMEGLPIK